MAQSCAVLMTLRIFRRFKQNCSNSESVDKRDFVVPTVSCRHRRPSIYAAYPRVARKQTDSSYPLHGLASSDVPSRNCCQLRWCALTAPFHPYLLQMSCDVCPSAVYFLLHEISGRPDLVFTSTLSCEVPTFLNVEMRTPQHCGRLTDSLLL